MPVRRARAKSRHRYPNDVLERRVNHAVCSQDVGHCDALKANKSRDPTRAFAFEHEQPFARRYQQMVAHHTLLALKSAARERLHDVKLAVGTDASRQRALVRQALAVGEYADMFA